MPFPHFDPVLIHLGPLAIRWYALAYVAGILLGWRYAAGLLKNLRLWGVSGPTMTVEQIDDLVLWITLGIILGGRIGYILFYDVRLIWTQPLEILQIWHGGMSFHGGLIGVSLALLVFAKANKLGIRAVGDVVTPAVPIGLFFGRIANFVNGELWGRPTSLPWGIVFPGAGPYPRHPSQLYEAALEGLVLFLVLRLATHGLHWLQRRGAVSGLFLTGYGLFRIALENVREPDVGVPHPLGLTMGMTLSLPMVICGLLLLVFAFRQKLPSAPARA